MTQAVDDLQRRLASAQNDKFIHDTAAAIAAYSPTDARRFLWSTDGTKLYYEAGGVLYQIYPTAAGAVTTVKEIDGNPTVTPASVIEFPNGTLSEPVGGTARYTPAAATINVTDNTTSVTADKIEFDPAFFDVIDNGSGDSEVTFVGSSGSIDVTDGTTTVSPTTLIDFDPAWFDVTDGGSDDAQVTLVTSPLQSNIFPVTYPPAVSQWTWVNQGGATATDDENGAITISKTSEGGSVVFRSLVRSLADPDNFDIKMGFIFGVEHLQESQGLMILRESSTGKMLAWAGGIAASGASFTMYLANLTNNTTYGSVHYNPASDWAWQYAPFYFRMRRSGGAAAITCEYGHGGRHWQSPSGSGDVTVTSPFTTAPDQYGFGVYCINGKLNLTLFSLQGSEWP